MSSYQFVNSLASCYQQSQSGRPGGSPLDTGSPATSDYYGQNSGVVPSYGTAGCYSPQQYAGQYMQQSPTAAMMDYTQLHTAQQHQRIQHLQQLQQHHHHQSLTSPGAMSPILGANNNNNNNSNANNNNNPSVTSLVGAAGAGSCKYEVASPGTMVTANGIGSPQDLTTSSTQQPNRTPPLTSAAAAIVKTQPRTPGPAGTSPSAGVGSQSTGPASQSSSSPASSEASSPGGTNNSSSAGGKSGSGNPPQIYPWMKRVHLGQSKCFFELF